MPEPYESNAELVDSANPAPAADPAPSPDPAPKDDTPADPAPEVTPKADEPILYETPDGRKVDAETLQKEWKENFLPEFTKKSQRLAELERGGKDLNSPKDGEPDWKKPDYVPQNYAEVIELAKREALEEIKNNAKAEEDRILAIQTAVDNEIADLKKVDPKLDENALFAHANKYGFTSLKAAHSNMSDMRKAIVDTEQRTVKNLKTRDADPISAGANGDVPENSGYDPNEMSKFDNANEYLSFIRGKK